MSSFAADARDNALADFFKAATELLKLCTPLLKAAVEERTGKRRT